MKNQVNQSQILDTPPSEIVKTSEPEPCQCGNLYCNVCFYRIAAKDMRQSMRDEIKLYGRIF